MHATTGHAKDGFALKTRDHCRRGLVWVAVTVHRHPGATPKAKLPTRARAPAVQVSRGRHGQGMGLAAGNVDNLLVGERLQQGGCGKMRDTVRVLPNPRVIVGAQLSTRVGTPAIEAPISVDGERVRIAAGQTDNVFQTSNTLRCRHVRAVVRIHWHSAYVLDAELAIGTPTEGIHVSSVRQSQRVDVATRSRHDPMPPQLFNLARDGLKRIAVLVRRKTARVGVTQLPARTSAPGEHSTTIRHGNRVRLATRHGGHAVRPEMVHDAGRRLVWASILILGHLGRLGMAELPTTATTPAIKQTFARQRHCVRVAARDLHDANVLEAVHKQRHWLVGVAFNVLGHVLGVAVPQLSTRTGTPTVQLSVYRHRGCVTITTGDLTHFHVERLYQAGSWLIRVSILVLWQVLQ
mmetsp:Transcript_9213/g.25776  ORF Transcript_9213/g.25776 Transcript_9213/m.25776 type:complete len:407 (+) Transcript_9213:427-1647(+)